MPDHRMTDPLALARRIYTAASERDRAFPEVAFDQPAWSIMLDLYIAHHEGTVVNMFGASVASRVPQSTAHRWLERLEEVGLVGRRTSSHNGRDVLVALSPDALARMDALLASIGNALGADLSAQDGGAEPDPGIQAT